MMNESLNQRLANVARIAVLLEAETAVPARLLIAQWAVESHWGAKPVGDANYFGIKKAARHAKCCMTMTREVIAGQEERLRLEFADYSSLDESCRDYAWLISHGEPYRQAWERYRQTGDVDALVEGLAKVYATDPSYATLLKQIAAQANVGAAIQAAQGEITV